ncbi:MAG: DUF6308 family protein [Polyangiales bacterium]
MSAVSLEGAEEKLAFRASLPGAFGFDQAAHVLRVLQSEGVASVELLPLAFPTSWMVNAQATSRAFRKWFSAIDVWAALLDELAPTMSLEQWSGEGTERVKELSLLENAGLAAVTKVLALLRPQLVPLMDDAQLSFALGTVPMPDDNNRSTATADHFAPMMTWFASQVTARENELIAIAAQHRQAVLDAAQVFDRLLWYDAWGHRHRGTQPGAGSVR